MEKVTSRALNREFGKYRVKAHQEGVIITHHGNDDLALISADEYERLKELDTRRAYYPPELPDEIKTELEKGFQGRRTPELDHLLK